MYVQINFFAFAVLLLIFINTKQKSKTPDLSQKLFNALLIANALMLLSDSANIALDGMTFPFSPLLHRAAAWVYLAAAPVPCFLWSLFVRQKIHRDIRRLKKSAVFSSLPVLVNLIFSTLSLFHDFVFFIDGANRYHRGSFFEIMPISCYFYLLYTLSSIFIRRKQMDRKLWLFPLAYGLLPFAAGLLELRFSDLPLAWTSMVLSTLMIFINFQNDQLFEDHLTGLGNRRYLDSFLRNTKNLRDDGHRIAGIMIDVDSFKQINDHFGHNAGDLALDHTGRLLKECLRRSDVIARYGGDEFIILLKIKEDCEVEEVVVRIRENIAQFNLEKQVPFEIRLSIGYDILEPNSKISISDFIHHIDNLMYKDKEHNKKLESN